MKTHKLLKVNNEELKEIHNALIKIKHPISKEELILEG